MPALVLFAYIAIPVLEIATVIWMASLIGGWWALAALLGCSLLGAVLVTRGGRRAMESLREAARNGAPPDRQLSNASLVFVGGVLLLIPGFLTSLVGAFWALPVTRPLTRRWLAWTTRRRAERYAEAMRAAQQGPYGGAAPGSTAPSGSGSPGGGSGTVIQGDVLSSRDAGGENTGGVR